MARDVAVVGAGAIGSYLGGRLAEAGRDVLLVGRGPHVDAINARGLLVEDAAGARRVGVDAATALSEPAEVVVVATRTGGVAEAARQAAEAAPGALVVTVQNGVRADAMAAGVVGWERVVGAVVVFDATFLEPGRVTLNRPGRLLVGRPRGTADAGARRVAGILSAAAPVDVRDHLAGCRWMKLLVNLNNALPAATGLSVQEVYGHPRLARGAARAMQEGARAVRAAGKPLASIPWASRPLVGAVSRLPEAVAARLLAWRVRRVLGDAPSRPSTLQSVLRGVATEVDHLNGEVVRLGAAAGVATPANAALVDLVHGAEKGGFASPAEAAARLGV